MKPHHPFDWDDFLLFYLVSLFFFLLLYSCWLSYKYFNIQSIWNKIINIFNIIRYRLYDGWMVTPLSSWNLIQCSSWCSNSVQSCPWSFDQGSDQRIKCTRPLGGDGASVRESSMAPHGDEVALLCEPHGTPSSVTPRRQGTFLPLALVSGVVVCFLLVVPFLFYGREFLVSICSGSMLKPRI